MNQTKKNEPSALRTKLRRQKEAFFYELAYRALNVDEKHNKKVVVFFPHLPKDRHVLGRIFRILKYEITDDLRRAEEAEYIVNWEDTTFRQSFPHLNLVASSRDVINYHCVDISKRKVDEVFGRVFGYTTLLNPRTYRGTCVEKSDINALHDGHIVECPISNPKDGCIYQKIINNKVSDSLVEDIRIPVYKGKIPFLYLKNRPIDARFASSNTKVRVKETHEVLSKEEEEKIEQFCLEMGLDHGELDVLRDRDDQRIYIVDVNNTPGGPPNGLSNLEQLRVFYRLAKAFKDHFHHQERELVM